MADEVIGGIAVEIGATDSKLDSALDAAEQKIQKWVDRIESQYSVNLNVSTPTGGATPTGPARRAKAEEPPPVRFAAAGVYTGGATPGQSPLDRAINQQLEKQGASQRMLNGVLVDLRDYNRQTRTTGSKSTTTAPQQPVATPPPAQFANLQALAMGDMTRTVSAVMAAVARNPAGLARIARAFSLVAPPAPTMGGGGAVRRARRTAAVATNTTVEEGEEAAEIDPYKIAMRRNIGASRLPRDPDVEANRREFAVRQRMFINGIVAADRIPSTARPQSPGERAILDALFPSPQAAAETQGRRRAGAEARLGALSAQAEQENQGAIARGYGGFAPLRTGAFDQAAEDARIRSEREAERTRMRGANETAEQQRARERRATPPPTAEPYELPEERETARARGGRGGVGLTRRAALTQEDIARREQERVAISESQTLTTGRTLRTQESSLGGFLAGRRGLIQAQAALAAENQRVRISERDVAEARAYANRPDVRGNPEEYRRALEDVAAAEEHNAKNVSNRAAALQKVQSYSTPFAAARSLLGIAAAGAAFGAGMQAITIGVQAAERASKPYFDKLTGYTMMTNDYTGALADQVRQQQGNAQGVTALKLAEAGYATTTAASLQPIISQRAQIEAGNKAIQEQIDTFRIAETLRAQAPTAGLASTTGGILGTSLFGIPSTGEQVGNFLQGLTPTYVNNTPNAQAGGSGPRTAQQGAVANQQFANSPAGNAAQLKFQRGLDLVNEQLSKGGDASAQFVQALDANDTRIAQTAAAFHGLSPEMEKAITDNRLYSAAIASSADPLSAAIDALRALNIAGTQVGSAQQLAAEKIRQFNAANSKAAIQSQQAYERPAFLDSLRMQQAQQSIQIKAQAGLGALAAPLPKVGTGIVGTAEEQAKIAAAEKDTQALQDTLNAKYQVGKDIIESTYKPSIIATFGQAAGQTFSGLISDLTTTGAAINTIQMGIANETAAYETAQYSNQLRIAQRSLVDIRQLTGQIGQSSGDNLGIYERQNLLLGRQGQQLQFMLSQRQINLQVATAGFQVPGLTPAEQNARVEEAKIEASYAQKQLDIQKEMFGNQVQIVDIGNLRQALDISKSVELLFQGRAVTIDTKLANERVAKLQADMALTQAQIGTYTSAVDSLNAKSISDIVALETATGSTISNIEKQGVLAAYNVGHAFYLGISGGFLGPAGGSMTMGTSGTGPYGGKPVPFASGGLFNTTGPTAMTVGEAAGETVAVLRNPRPGNLAGGMGGGSLTINFNGGLTVRTAADIDEITRKVIKATGRQAALQGLRAPN